MPLYSGADEPRFNETLNPQGSQYAANHSHDESILIEKITNRAIFDASPKQFFDLKLLNMKNFIPSSSDEFFFQEMGYQREAISVSSTTTAGANGATVTLTITNPDSVVNDTIVVMPDNVKAIVSAKTATTIDVTPVDAAEAIPAIDGSTTEVPLANHSGVEADKVDEFRYCKVSTVERFNYIQLLSKAICYGEVELYKLKNAASTSNFLEMERNNMYRQLRIDASNIFWNGVRGEVTLSNGRVAKTTGGIIPTMAAAQSPVVASVDFTSTAAIRGAIEEVALSTEFQDYGDVRFLFATPQIILGVSQAYKSYGAESTVRYSPNDEIAKLALTEINLGSSRIVLVPFTRFSDTASFPASFRVTAYLLDLKNINLRSMWGERSGETPDNRTNGYRKNWKEVWVDMNIGVQFNNPLACGSIVFNNVPSLQ